MLSRGLAARTQHFRGNKIGAFLLLDALKRSLAVSQQIGMVAVIVDAKDEVAVDFYKHFGFISFPENNHRLFLPLSTIKPIFRSKVMNKNPSMVCQGILV